MVSGGFAGGCVWTRLAVCFLETDVRLSGVAGAEEEVRRREARPEGRPRRRQISALLSGVASVLEIGASAIKSLTVRRRHRPAALPGSSPARRQRRPFSRCLWQANSKQPRLLIRAPGGRVRVTGSSLCPRVGH